MAAYGPFELAPLEAVAVTAPRDGAPDLDAVRAEAYDDGFAAGEAQALQALAGPAAAFAAAAQELTALRAQAADAVEAEAVELALRIAEQALGAAVAARPERVLDAVRGALRRLVERERVLIFVHPDDLDAVRDQVARLVSELGGIEHCEVQAERRVSPGGAVVRTAEGEVDASLQTKLARAREVLEHELADG
jgi:flagellar assembly protein FliH